LSDIPAKRNDLVSRLETDYKTEPREDDRDVVQMRRRYKFLCHTLRREQFAAESQTMEMKSDIDRLKRRLNRVESHNSISFDGLSRIVSGVGGDPERLKKSSSGFQYRGVSFFVDRKDGAMIAVERDEGVLLESFIRAVDGNSFSPPSAQSSRTHN
jgi:hypothetical protein